MVGAAVNFSSGLPSRLNLSISTALELEVPKTPTDGTKVLLPQFGTPRENSILRLI